jgi:Family of unknown function (DUF6535)
VTIADLKPDPQEKPTFYLENIYKLLADGNVTVSRPSITVEPPRFSPPNYAIWVNSLWFLSLCMSLTSAMLATMLQQWARRYVRITEKPRSTPHDGARIRAFFAQGLERLRFSWVAEAIPLLIHMSLILFFTGLLIYLFNIHHTVFYAAVWWIGLSAAVYLVITILPVLRVSSPYYSPFSSLVFRIFAALLHIVSFLDRFRGLAAKYSFCKGFSKSIENMAREEVTKRPWKVDRFILKWTFDTHSLASARQLDQFFSDIYDFYNSNIIQDPRRVLNKLGFREFCSAWMAFMKRTFSLTSLSDPHKMEQFKKYLKVADAIDGSASSDSKMGLLAQTSVANILANVPMEGRDDRWIKLAADQMDISENDVRRYLEFGNDTMSLATWIHMARLISNSPTDAEQDVATYAAERILQPPSQFDIQNTLPELQHKFCSLWNEVVAKAQESGDGSIPHLVIFLLRDLYEDLHRGTEDALPPSFHKLKASSYPSCRNTHHLSQETPTNLVLPLIPSPTTFSETDTSPVASSPLQDNEIAIGPRSSA